MDMHKLAKAYAIRKGILGLRGGLDGQACLANAARPDESQEATFRIAQQVAEFVQLAVAADQGGREDGQVRARLGSGLAWGGASVGTLLRCGREAVNRQFATGHLDKRRALLGRNLEGMRDQVSDLDGGPALVGLELAQGRDRASHAFGELLAREPEVVSSLAQPFTKGDGLIHGGPLA
jgi:hypothetical protein